MGQRFAELPHWEFTVDEFSAGLFRVTAAREGGITADAKGVDPEAALAGLRSWAISVERDIRVPMRGADIKKLAIRTLQELGFEGRRTPLIFGTPDLEWSVRMEVTPTTHMFSAWLGCTIKSLDPGTLGFDRRDGDISIPTGNLKFPPLEFDGPLVRCVGYRSQVSAVEDHRFVIEDEQRATAMKALYLCIFEFVQTTQTNEQLRTRYREGAFNAAFIFKEARAFLEQ